MPTLALAILWCLLLSDQLPTSSLSEKQAVSGAQQALASELDAELPARPFADWLREVVGAQAGVNWQLNECGAQPDLLLAQGRELPACAEMNALLADGRKVVVMIEVGTFKKGSTRAPSFYHAAIEQQGELYRVRRLRDLPEGLRAPATLAAQNAIKLAPRDAQLVWTAQSSRPSGDVIGDVDMPPPLAVEPAKRPAPPPTQAVSEGISPAAQPVAPPPAMLKLSEVALRNSALAKVPPLYPAGAKRAQAAGAVQVQITISKEGRVVAATAINGHPLLRRAAVEAALKWVFNTALTNGVPVEAQGTLTFVFTPSP